MIGRTINVLIEEKSDDRTWICRSEYDAPEVDGIFYLTAENVSVNTICRARVTDALEYDLIGVIDR
jgi:ribosomal protein S12 methylthiotransferase